jgi:adenosylcobinamide-GDP ribazoletransferase
MITRELGRIATAATFLTRAPWVARWSSGDPRELAASVRWFPLVGVGVGLWAALVYIAADALLPREVAALLAVAAMVLATGAFHEDGWADTFDGIWGGMDRERRLAIMRDSRIGTYGAVALVLMLALRWTCLVHLPASWIPAALVAAHAWARWTAPAMVRLLPYARDGGANKPIAEGAGTTELLVATGVAMTATVPLALVAPPLAVVVVPLLAPGVIAGAATLFRARLGGITGDGLGATNVATELAVLLALVAWAGYA